MLLGVHCSVAGGVVKAFNQAEELKIDTFQIFTKNQRQWKEKIIDEKEGGEFRVKFSQSKVKIGISHSTYLINLATSDEQMLKNSIMTLAGEVCRCDALNLSYTVLHPGTAKNCTENEAIQRIADGLKIVLNHTRECSVKILLENTAGQGNSIGRSFEQISSIMDLVQSPRIGMCLDTCHAFAAGYDIRTQVGFEDMIEQLDKTVGLKKLYAIHLNDSKGALGSRIDRHEHIGKGCIGLEPFRYIMNNFPHLPKILETAKENNMDAVNLDVLRNII